MITLTDMNNRLTLEILKNEYSTALYSYFRITNLKESYEKFRLDPSKPPVFKYSSVSSLNNVNSRIRKLRTVIKDIDTANQAEIAFVEWRIAESLLLREFRKIYEKHRKPTSRMVDKYIADQEELYGELDPKVFGGILRYIRITSHRRGATYTKAMDEIEKKINAHSSHHLFIPKDATFQHYKDVFHQCFPELLKSFSGIRSAEQYSQAEIISVFERALEAIGAKDKGWEVVFVDGGANVTTAKYGKKIMVGIDFRPTSSLRLKQIAAHEVGCHVQRAITNYHANVQTLFDENEEGLALVLEQLLGSRFTYKRVLRYFAIGLAVGFDGKKRNFSEVYEILWRSAYILHGNKKRAKEQAFYETARAFRGGLPSVPGLVYIKDKIYLESNLKVWQQLQEKQLNKTQFHSLFRAPNSVLSKEITK